ncbi:MULTISPECIES: hypothetical protein [Okeania]|uniref:Uncharacterized protein n=1 Tax=Okeania hirsuta TaxID=1458930 RepID=A0A3N6NZ31_9CYAN|nr:MULTISPECIES: hypothetical protein [Okeania]NEP05413.1 hypothetical protein [Okeania sp. SIO4D6]NEP38123.1 hypothetical protein [Okeania sp. SIO2H7]NET16361.1 hypothetical protein [Okeania sp. SIO1H6]NEP72201.1 hypothetical protein [Okeania sp. SIO2G5]NEP94682.1 hypothetical protein [Okeania sp. SIO2F5]
MSELQELRKKALNLSVSDRLSLLKDITDSLNEEFRPRRDLKAAIEGLRGIAKTDDPPPTDAEVEAMLEERLVEKYLK